MIFRPDLAQQVLRGQKTVTRRLVSDNPRSPWWRDRCALVPGRHYAVCPGRGARAVGRIRIVSVSRQELGHLSAADARREGFPDVPSFVQAWTDLNGRYDPAALVWRVEFEPLPHTQPRTETPS